MKVIICGAGQVGWQIAQHLSTERNDVVVVDNNHDLIARASDTLDVSGIAGNASYPDVLARAGAEDADMIIAATHSDEVNMITCQMAHSIFKIPRKIARLRGQAYLDAIYSDIYQRDHLPIDVVISPEREVATHALRQLKSPATFEVEPFIDGKVELIGLSIDEDCNILNTPLHQLSELFPTLCATIVGIRRENKLFVPTRDAQLFPKDKIYLIANVKDKLRCLEIFGKSTQKQSRVVIIGGGNVGYFVARALEQSSERIHTKIIEHNRTRAEEVAELLERTIVLHGDGLDVALLEEANINRADAVMAVTDDDKINLLACARAKTAGCPMTISLINDMSFTSLMEPLLIDASINPRATTVSSILRHIRHGRVRSVYSIGNAEAEVIETEVMSTSPITGLRVRDINWPAGVLLGVIQKGDDIISPTGNTIIEGGDVIVLFTQSRDVQEVERLLQVSVDFF